MLVLFCLIASALPLTLVEGKTCVAAQTSPGTECQYDTVVSGSTDSEILYKLHPSVRICCEARSCTTTKCEFEDFGCGSTLIQRTLQWEKSDETPCMKCYESPSGSGASYNYTVELVTV